MQLAVSFDACVPLAPQHDFPPAKDEVAANTPAANKAKVVLIMHLRQHELRNVQLAVAAILSPTTFRAVIPSRGGDEGPRLREWKMQDSLCNPRFCVRSLACARDDAHCKGHDLTCVTLSLVTGFRWKLSLDPAAAGLGMTPYRALNSIAPFFASARMVWPSPNFPSRMFMLKGSSR